MAILEFHGLPKAFYSFLISILFSVVNFSSYASTHDVPDAALNCLELVAQVNPVFGWTNGDSGVATIKRSWIGATTNPLYHSPSGFRYIVSTLRGVQLSSNSIQTAIAQLSKRDIISASLISKEVNGTLGNWGIILRIHPDNLIATAPFDVNQPNESVKGNEQATYSRYGLHTPDALLRETRRGQTKDPLTDWALDPLNQGSPKDSDNWNMSKYNEIKLSTSKEQPQIQVEGFFVRRNSSFRQKITVQQILILLNVGEALNLPVVFLEQK